MGRKLRSTEMFLQTGTLTTGKPPLEYLIGQAQASGAPTMQIFTSASA